MSASTPTISNAPARRRNWSVRVITILSVAVLVALVFFAAFAEWLSPYDPLRQSLREALQGPSGAHWLGTDDLGRDVLSRMIYGCRIALIAAFEATTLAVIIGIPIGLFIGYRGGWWDWIVMRIVEVVISIPGIMVAIVIIAILGPGLHRAMIALGILYSTAFLRLARSVVLAEREEVYVKSARVIGASDSRILINHIFPNIAPPLIVQITLTVCAVLLSEAGLSFIGLGAQPPNASWGTMLNTAATYMELNAFLAIPPGLAIVVTVLAVNLLGDIIRDSVGRGVSASAQAKPIAQPTVANAAIATEPAAALKGDQVISIRNLHVNVMSKTGEEVPVITDLSLDIAKGETMGLVGESGCGKTITGLSILGLIGAGGRPVAGSINLDGTELLSLTEKQMEGVRGNEVALVFQDPTTSLNPAYTVGDQISEVLRTKLGLSRQDAWKRAIELIDRVGIPKPKERAKAYPHELSGGMAQRIAIARALSCNPKLLIADEPTTALDVTVQQEILDLFRDLQAEFGMAILFVTHDLAVAADICDKISVMYAGEIVERASIDQLFAAPRHPYTAGLLAAMPHTSSRNPPLPTIKGTVPTPRQWPEGCRFAERCTYRTLACGQKIDLTGSDRLVRCVRADELELEGTGGR